MSKPKPTPGQFLRELIHNSMTMTQDTLATALGVSRFTVSQIVNENRGVTAEMALRLEAVLGIPAREWLAMQQEVDMQEAQLKIGGDLSKLVPWVDTKIA